MPQTPQELFQDHSGALSLGDLDSLASGYAEDALVLSPTGEYRGRASIRGLFEGMLQSLPEAAFELRSASFADNVALIEWQADSVLNSVPDGVDTFVFEGEFIRVQTISFTLTPKS